MVGKNVGLFLEDLADLMCTFQPKPQMLDSRKEGKINQVFLPIQESIKATSYNPPVKRRSKKWRCGLLSLFCGLWHEIHRESFKDTLDDGVNCLGSIILILLGEYHTMLPRRAFMELKEILLDIHSLEEELLAYERKYGIRSEIFYAAYVGGEEPEDDRWVLDFGEWASIYRTWLLRQSEYRDQVQRIRKNAKSLTGLIHESL
jgi:hypothetical protein